VEYDRAGSGTSGLNLAPSAVVPGARSSISPRRVGANDDFDPGQLRQLDRSSLISSTAFSLENVAEPRIVGLTYGQDQQPVLFSASNLRGVTAERADQDLNLLGLTTFDEAKLRNDLEQGRRPNMIGAPFQTRFDPTQAGTPGTPDAPNAAGTAGNAPRDNRILPPGTSTDEDAATSGARGSHGDSYDNIVRSMKDRYQTLGTGQMHSGAEPQASRLEQDYQQLRKQLSQGAIRSVNSNDPAPAANSNEDQNPGDERDPNARDESGVKPRTPLDPATGSGTLSSPAGIQSSPRPGLVTDMPTGDRRPGATPNAGDRPGTEAGSVPGQPGATDMPTPLTLDQYGVILRHGQKVESLSSENQDRFNELMSSAEEKLRQGEYFWAERRFERALRFTPGHPLATAGSAHAQIGAGLYLSSALTLHNLFTSQPEMIDVIYAPSLLPNRERMDESIRQLRLKLDEEHSAESPSDRANFAFVLSYLGHQLGDDSLMNEGLDGMTKYAPNDPLLPLLGKVWHLDEAGK